MNRVLVDLGKLKSLYTGLGQVSLYFGQTLARNKPDDLELTYLLPGNYKGAFGQAVEYRSISTLRRYFPQMNNGYNLWHAIHQDSAYMPAKSTPYLLTIHDLNFLREKSDSKIRARLGRLQKKVNRACAVAFISDFARTEARSHLDIQVPDYVIYNGLNKSVEAPQKPSFLKDIRRSFFFSVGVIIEKKNIHVLVGFMEKYGDALLVIAGDKSSAYARCIEEEIHKKNLSGRILMPGIVSDSEKQWLYQNCEAFLFPSLNEGFGLPVIEALSYGKPVFLSRETSLPEIAGDVGYYWPGFDPDTMASFFRDKMKTARHDIEVTRRKTRAGLFSWEKNVSQYIKLYEKYSD